MYVASKNVLDRSKPITIKFVTQEGKERVVTGPTGQDLLTLAHENDIDLEGIPCLQERWARRSLRGKLGVQYMPCHS